MEGSTELVQTGAKDIGRKALTYAEQNVAAALDFAGRLVNAKDPQEVLQLQSEFMRCPAPDLRRAGEGHRVDREPGRQRLREERRRTGERNFIVHCNIGVAMHNERRYIGRIERRRVVFGGLSGCSDEPMPSRAGRSPHLDRAQGNPRWPNPSRRPKARPSPRSIP